MITITLTPYDLAVIVALWVVGAFFHGFFSAAGVDTGRALKRLVTAAWARQAWRRHHEGYR